MLSAGSAANPKSVDAYRPRQKNDNEGRHCSLYTDELFAQQAHAEP
jgi:hypothetical protein